jgi:hypothetical protein
VTKYKLMPGWTKEKVIEKIYTHNTGEVSYQTDQEGITNQCVYMKPDGSNRCFIGCFLPDKHEGLYADGPVIHLLNKHPDLWPWMPFRDIDALKHFQDLHDIYFREADIVPEDIRENVKPWLDEFVEDSGGTQVVS